MSATKVGSSDVKRRMPSLPDGVRVGWVSEEAESVWAPRFGAIARMVSELERESVVAGLRRCSWGFAESADLPSFSRWAAERGLSCLPLAWERRPQGYVAGGEATESRLDSYSLAEAHMRLVVGSPSDVCEFADAYASSDHAGIGELLAYPRCCLEFFQRTWAAGSIDGTWEQLSACGDLREGVQQVLGGALAHTLHRHVGVRAVFHLPCSMHCQHSMDIALRHLELAEDIGFSDEVAWAREVLDWPVRWSARNALAELVSPVHRTVARTDPGSGRREAHYRGSIYPEEGARGNRFPFRLEPTPARPLLETYKKLGGLREEVAGANGFGSYRSMLSAHESILGVVKSVVARLPASRRFGTVWDLGGGTGTLLAAVAEVLGTPEGMTCVERSERAIALGKRLYGQKVEFLHADILRVRADLEKSTVLDVLVVTPGRLLEQRPVYASGLLSAIKRWPGLVIVYQYSDSKALLPGLVAMARDWWAGRDLVFGEQGSFAVLPLGATGPGMSGS